MKKAARKRKTSQYKFRRETFSFYQYWLMYYTEVYIDGSQKDFASFIKSRSYEMAKQIITSKIKEDCETTKVKSLVGYMLHKDYQNSRAQLKLSMSDWDSIKSSAFPNLNNFLFKEELARPEGYTNKYNKTDFEHLKTIGFRKGAQNWSTVHRKGKTKPLHERKGLKWNGDRWIEWDKEEMKKTKNQIINALIVNRNNRVKAADYLGISRSGFYSMMMRCEDLEWWNTNYPFAKRRPPRVSKEERSKTQKRVMAEHKAKGLPCFPKRQKFEEKRLTNLRSALENKKQKYSNTLVPKIKEALINNNNIRAEAARSLGIKDCTFQSWLKKTRFLVDWTKEYPSSYVSRKNK